MANEQRKHELLSERDKKVLDKAEELGLTKDYQPIVARPIGDELVDVEERWNEREKKKVSRLEERNNKILSKPRVAGKLREWEP